MATEAEKAVERRRAEAAERYRLNMVAVDFDFEVPGWQPGRETADEAEKRIRAEFEEELAAFAVRCKEAGSGSAS